MESIMNYLDYFLGKVIDVNRWYETVRKENEMVVLGVAILVALLTIVLFTPTYLILLVVVLGLVRFYGLTRNLDDKQE